jgi:hypothetical protein
MSQPLFPPAKELVAVSDESVSDSREAVIDLEQ